MIEGVGTSRCSLYPLPCAEPLTKTQPQLLSSWVPIGPSIASKAKVTHFTFS